MRHQHHLSHHLLLAPLLVSCAPTCIWTELRGFTEDHIWKRSHRCIRYRAAPCVWRCGIWKKASSRVKKRRGGGEGGQSSDKKYASVPCANKVPRACLLPGVGREMRPVREWGGWLNDFTSPFQLQQLPIYIVMQIHGLSQMVLFQHRGCREIWLFIPSTSKVFNASSSVCFYPLLSLAAV